MVICPGHEPEERVRHEPNRSSESTWSFESVTQARDTPSFRANLARRRSAIVSRFGLGISLEPRVFASTVGNSRSTIQAREIRLFGSQNTD